MGDVYYKFIMFTFSYQEKPHQGTRKPCPGITPSTCQTWSVHRCVAQVKDSSGQQEACAGRGGGGGSVQLVTTQPTTIIYE